MDLILLVIHRVVLEVLEGIILYLELLKVLVVAVLVVLIVKQELILLHTISVVV